jgi:hypothetical protein
MKIKYDNETYKDEIYTITEEEYQKYLDFKKDSRLHGILLEVRFEDGELGPMVVGRDKELEVLGEEE